MVPHKVIELRTQKQLRNARRIPFCCICGIPFDPQETPNRQHVPPQAIFAKEDHDSPLILPAHEKCNGNLSLLDEQVGQLVAALHGKYPADDNLRLHLKEYRTIDTHPTIGMRGLRFNDILFPWVRCFHAALYREYLTDNGYRIFEPFPAGAVVDGRLVYRKVSQERLMLTEFFKRQVKAGKTDAVICFNGKCEYRCTWFTFADERTRCVFGLRLYNWEELGDSSIPKMGCVGWYFADIPPSAARSTLLEIPVQGYAPLDPFAI